MHVGPAATMQPGAMNPQFCALAKLGYTIIAPNYRGSFLRQDYQDQLKGNENQLPFEDVQAALDYIKKGDELDSSKIVLTGISYGTYLNSIILNRISDQLAGAFLQTGFYGNPDPPLLITFNP